MNQSDAITIGPFADGSRATPLDYFEIIFPFVVDLARRILNYNIFFFTSLLYVLYIVRF